MLQPTPANPPLPRDLWLKRLTYRSLHRGCKETDLVLGTYCVRMVESLPEAELHLFESFLNEDDSDIWAWLIEKIPCPHPEYAPLLEQLRQQKVA